MMHQLRQQYQSLGWWGAADHLVHRLPCPKRVQYWVCEHFDRSVGLYDDAWGDDE